MLEMLNSKFGFRISSSEINNIIGSEFSFLNSYSIAQLMTTRLVQIRADPDESNLNACFDFSYDKDMISNCKLKLSKKAVTITIPDRGKELSRIELC